jgi:hypothetical protein
MIKVLIYVPANHHMYLDEFNRRFRGKFPYSIRTNGIFWENMIIAIVNNVESARGCRADIAINFSQIDTNMFTCNSCINIKEKRITSYFDLLNAINDDGSFSWEKYLQQEQEDDWNF